MGEEKYQIYPTLISTLSMEYNIKMLVKAWRKAPIDNMIFGDILVLLYLREFILNKI